MCCSHKKDYKITGVLETKTLDLAATEIIQKRNITKYGNDEAYTTHKTITKRYSHELASWNTTNRFSRNRKLNFIERRKSILCLYVILGICFFCTIHSLHLEHVRHLFLIFSVCFFFIENVLRSEEISLSEQVQIRLNVFNICYSRHTYCIQ